MHSFLKVHKWVPKGHKNKLSQLRLVVIRRFNHVSMLQLLLRFQRMHQTTKLPPTVRPAHAWHTVFLLVLYMNHVLRPLILWVGNVAHHHQTDVCSRTQLKAKTATVGAVTTLSWTCWSNRQFAGNKKRGCSWTTPGLQEGRGVYFFFWESGKRKPPGNLG